MSVKQEVFNYLGEKPDTPLQALIKQLSHLNSSTVRRYYFEYKRDKVGSAATSLKKSGPSSKTAKGPKSLRSQIMAYLDKNPESDSGELYQAFSKANRKTVRNYLHQWRSNRPQKTADGKIEDKVFQYLDRHPQINLNELKNVFPDGGKKLITIFRNWKKGQEGSGKTKKDVSVSQQKMIKSLKSVVEKQKVMIEQQRQRIKELKSQLGKKSPASLSSLKRLFKETLLRSKK